WSTAGRLMPARPSRAIAERRGTRDMPTSPEGGGGMAPSPQRPRGGALGNPPAPRLDVASDAAVGSPAKPTPAPITRDTAVYSRCPRSAPAPLPTVTAAPTNAPGMNDNAGTFDMITMTRATTPMRSEYISVLPPSVGSNCIITQT